MLLAARGASVVVNDLGGSIEGTGADAEPASRVVGEITDAGGQAVSDASDVSTSTGAQALVDLAIGQFGHLDVVINNAGIIRWGGFPEVDEGNLTQHLAVHTFGSFHVTRAAWPHMVERRYGRVVMTTSSGIFGLRNNTSYATAKAAVIGLTRSVAVAAAKHGIRVNLIAPAAMTRMAGDGDAPGMAPELVAPMAAYLAHESCPANGEMFAAGAGRFARIFLATTAGYVHPGADVTIEDVAAHWSDINDESGYSVPTDLPDWSARFLSHLPPGDLR
jgi:NAD(P)-dependent dehydrogenase (short-subunit alcohol dehydrogenase family)